MSSLYSTLKATLASSKSYNELVKKANYFYSTTLEDTSIISTYLLGKKVYNIRHKKSNKVLGYLAYLVSIDRLESLVNYILRKALENYTKVFTIIIYYSKEDRYFFITKDLNSTREEELTLEEIKKSFKSFKERSLSRFRYVLISILIFFILTTI